MRHPFRIGGKYRNRNGQYEVVELDGPKMVIRYTDGKTVEATVDTQERIQINMQAEQVDHTLSAQQATKGPKARAEHIRFDGLVDNDFQNGVTGTHWRARETLGGLLVKRLSARTGRRFKSFSQNRQPRVYIGEPAHYQSGRDRSIQQAKLLFVLDPECARYGLYIEKNNGPMDAAWHWPNLIAALKTSDPLQKTTLDAMHRLSLYWSVCTYYGSNSMALVTRNDEGLLWQPEEGVAEAISWGQFVQRLENLGEDTWCDLYLWGRTDKDEAIAAGSAITDSAVEVYSALLPIYDAAVGG